MSAKTSAVLLSVLCACAGVRADAITDALARPQQRSGQESVADSVYDSVFAEIVRKDLAADAAWTAPADPAAIAARQKDLRARFVSAIGGFPARAPLNPRTTGRLQRDGYVLEKIVFESRPGMFVTAHLFLPDAAKFPPPWPGLISPCGHSLSGKNAPWYQRPGVLGALNGFATLVYDPIDQGERLQFRPSARETWSTTGEHNRLGVRAFLVGWNTAQFRIWDAMRALDFLQSRKDVDGSRLAVYGISGGGTLTSYVMALDDRVRAACPAGFISTMRAVCDHCGPQDAEQNVHGQLAFGLNHLGYVLLRAPSPVMMNCTHDDFFPFAGSLETYAAAKRCYGVLGAPDAVTLFDVPGPHHWYESQQTASVAWMRHVLAGAPAPTEADLRRFRLLDVGFSYAKVDVATADLARPQRWCTETGKVTPTGFVLDLPGARTTYDFVRDEAARAAAARKPLSVAAVRGATGMRPRSALGWTACDVVETKAADVKIRAATLVTEENLRIPTVSFYPSKSAGTPALVVSDAVTRTNLVPRVKELIAKGRPVMVAEVRGFGETGKLRRGAPSWGFYGCKDEDEELAMAYDWLGMSLVGLRAEDVVRAALAFAETTGAKPCEIIAEGRAVVPAVHARYVEPDLFGGISLLKEPAAWRKAVDDPALSIRFAETVFGALRVYDWPDLLGEAAWLVARGS